MRPNQNRRMRGRNRPKGPNPLTRSYESNGPDVKLRGTAQHIADKYAQLARDALASGDPIAAENYFQHGEHYFRIITGAQEQQRPQSVQGYASSDTDEDEDGEENTGFDGSYGGQDQGRQGYGQDPRRNGHGEYGDPGQQPQPFERHDFENRQNQNRNDRPQRSDDRQDFRRDRFQNRNDRPQRNDHDRNDYNRGDNRQDGRPDNRQEHRQEHRPEHRQDQRPDNRHDNRQDGRPDNRFENRQDYRDNRQDVRSEPRADNNRQDFAPQPEPRNDYGRNDGPRERGNGRNDQPRQGEFPRRNNRRREEAPAPVAEEAGLPAFLMTATRNAPPPSEPQAEPAPTRASAPEPVEEKALPPAVDGGEEAAAPKPRRRRTRYKAAESGAEDRKDESPADASAE